MNECKFEDSYHIETDEQKGFKLIAGDNGGLATRSQVLALMRACQSHLDNLPSPEISERRAKTRREELEFDRRMAARPVATRPPGFVYLVRNKGNGLTKIGYSMQPKAREGTLQSQEPDLEMFATWPGSLSDERALHKQFAEFRVRGEWFNLSPLHVEQILSERSEHHSNGKVAHP